MSVGREEIQAAAEVLRAGGLVAVPTETVYGLGANAADAVAVRRIYAAKGRPATNPLIVHLASVDQLPEWAAEVPEAARLLAERFWPGPLTLVLPRNSQVPLETTGGLETVALRVPNHPVALALLSAFGGGVAAPSANRFGSVSPTTADDVRTELGDAVDYILDGGRCDVGVESTIVDVTGETVAILRPGGVSREDLEAVLGYEVAVPTTSHVVVPGQHPSHYAPRARVVLVDPEKIAAEADRAAELGHRVGVLWPPALGEPTTAAPVVLRIPASLSDYAHDLYDLLREFDRQSCDLVIASLPSDDGLGRAIANRLNRAAGPRP